MRKLVAGLLLCLLLPAAALAVQEGVVEEAPPITLEIAQQEETPLLGDLLMEEYRDRAREILRDHIGSNETWYFLYNQVMESVPLWDELGNVTTDDLFDERVLVDNMPWIPSVYVKFETQSQLKRASVVFDLRNGKLIRAEAQCDSPAVYEKGEALLSDEQVSEIAKAFFYDLFGTDDFELFDKPVWAKDGGNVDVRIQRENGDMLGAAMNGYTGEITCVLLYSIGEDRDYPEFEERASDLVGQLFGHKDMPLFSVQRKWYYPAQFDEDGNAVYKAKSRECVEVRFAKYAQAANFSYEADVLFDLETGEAVRAGVSYDFSDVEPAVGARYRRISDDDFGLRMGQRLADDYMSKWNLSVEMKNSPKSDARYSVCHGVVDEQWRFEFTMDRETGNALRHEFLRGE